MPRFGLLSSQQPADKSHIWEYNTKHPKNDLIPLTYNPYYVK